MKSLFHGCAVLVALSAVASFADDKKPDEKKAAAEPKKDAPPALPPEVKKTVDAMVGKWTFDGTLTGMSKDPIKMKETFVCRKAALGRVAACTGSANVPGMGKMEDEVLVTYDVEAKTVRFIGLDSMGEVHDHLCSWKDDKSMTCQPLSLTADGKPATVDLVAAWPDAKTMTLTETTTMKDGTKVVYEGTAKR